MISISSRIIVGLFIGWLPALAHAANTASNHAAIKHAASVGTVIFVHGEVWQQQPEQAEVLLHKGDVLQTGASLRTGAEGHAHIRWADQGFTSLKPKSQLQIVAFQRATATAPAQVKFELRAGTGRFVTGQIGEANKAAFRLNTPLAAIGIRGTDFAVAVAEASTVVAINRGEIVLAPLSANCLASAFGPCNDALALSLSARQRDQVIELNLSGKPFLRQKTEQDASLRQELPAPTQAVTVSSEPVLAELDWRHWTGAPDQALTAQGYAVAANNEVFSLYRKTDPIDLPMLGVVSFKPVGSEAYAVSASGMRLPATLSDMRLAVDFDQQRFDTGFVWTHEGNALSYQAKGDLLPKGIMQIDPNNAAFVSFYGLLSSRAKETAYIFEALTDSDLRALGLIRWQSNLR